MRLIIHGVIFWVGMALFATMSMGNNMLNEELLYASLGGHIDRVKQLLDAGAEVNAKDIYGSTPLYHAAYRGHNDIVAFLLDKGADITNQSIHGMTPLHVAVRDGQGDIVELLLDRGAHVNVRDFNGETPLHKAVNKDNKALVQVLIEKGAEVNARDSKGQTPLHKAVYKANQDMFLLLLNGGADINARDVHGKTPLHLAIRLVIKMPAFHKVYLFDWHLKTVKFLLGRGAFIDFDLIKDLISLLSPFEQKIIANDIESIKQELLIEKPIKNIELGLLIAVGQGRVEIVNFLLEYLVQNKSLGQEIVTEMQHALHAILRSRDLLPERRQSYQEILKRLFELVKDASVPQQGLTVAQKMGLPKEMEIALFNFLTHELSTPSGKLIYAALTNNVQAAREALKQGAYVNTQDPSGRTALHYFAYHGNPEGVDLLRECRSDRDIRDIFGDSAAALARRQRLAPEFVYRVMSPQQLLFTGAYTGELQPLELVLEEGVLINARVSGRTALSIAAERGTIEAIKLLVDHGADISAQDSNGRTALHYLALTNIPEPVAQEIAALLISLGANPLQQDYNGITPVEEARSRNNNLLARTLTPVQIVQALQVPTMQPPQTILSRIAGLFTGSGS